MTARAGRSVDSHFPILVPHWRRGLCSSSESTSSYAQGTCVADRTGNQTIMVKENTCYFVGQHVSLWRLAFSTPFGRGRDGTGRDGTPRIIIIGKACFDHDFIRDACFWPLVRCTKPPPSRSQLKDELCHACLNETPSPFLRLQGKKIRSMVEKTHRERVEEFNALLASMTEHNDIPRCSAAGNG